MFFTLFLPVLSCGLLDVFDTSTLDLIDKIVFDCSQPDMSVRVAALAFLLDHTVGFEAVAAGGEEEGEAKKKGSGGGSGAQRKSKGAEAVSGGKR